METLIAQILIAINALFAHPIVVVDQSEHTVTVHTELKGQVVRSGPRVWSLARRSAHAKARSWGARRSLRGTRRAANLPSVFALK